MSWESILKLKTRIWHKYVDNIMSDGQARDSTELYNKLMDFMRSPGLHGKPRSARNIPTMNSLVAYLRRSSKYAKVEPITSKNVVWEWVGE